MSILKTTLVALSLFCGTTAYAQELVGSYVAYIGTDDLYNSRGVRLTQPWQILRQDRANFHRFGIRQRGDEWDPFFESTESRAALERMVAQGTIEPIAASSLVNGGTSVFVRIYRYNNGLHALDVTVAR